jgi:hydrogenase maturation protein HypF
VPTTSAGRLFDAVAALLGLRSHATYEAQAAMELEATARRCRHDHRAPDLPEDATALPTLVAELIAGRASGVPLPCLARRFHTGLAEVTAAAATAVAAAHGQDLIGLSGGVAANRLFTGGLARALARRGSRLISHEAVPANDGGLSLGQALAGYLTLTRDD